LSYLSYWRVLLLQEGNGHHHVRGPRVANGLRLRHRHQRAQWDGENRDLPDIRSGSQAMAGGAGALSARRLVGTAHSRRAIVKPGFSNFLPSSFFVLRSSFFLRPYSPCVCTPALLVVGFLTRLANVALWVAGCPQPSSRASDQDDQIDANVGARIHEIMYS